MSQTGASLLARHALRMVTGFGSVPVVFGTVASGRTRGQFEHVPRDAASAEGFTARLGTHTLRVTGAWVTAQGTALCNDAAITVDGTEYAVRQVSVEDDGLTVLLDLVEVS